MSQVLYITHNGITDHIGQSQVAPYCLELARRGYSIHIVSAEKPGRAELKARYRRLFEAAGIQWSHVTYHNRPPMAAQFYDVMRMRRLALRIAERERPQLVHCRSYLPIPIGVAVKKKYGSRLLIDFRHFWVEAGLEDSPYKFVYRAFKRWEPGYFAAADHVVTLTRRAAGILNGWYPSREGMDRFTVIPCCADFDHFDLARVRPEQRARAASRLGLADEEFVLLYLGSIGPDYLVGEMMKLFRELLALRPKARFLFVSNNGEPEVMRAAAAAGVDPARISFVNAPRDDVPAYLALADLSVFFYRPDLSRAGCSPTKLAELLAANVPVIGNAGVGDVGEILSIDRNGSLAVPDFEPATLRAALERVLAVDPASRSRIRANSREFTLQAGADLYASIYRKFVPGPEVADARAAPGRATALKPSHA